MGGFCGVCHRPHCHQPIGGRVGGVDRSPFITQNSRFFGSYPVALYYRLVDGGCDYELVRHKMMQVLGGNDQGVRIATQIEQGTRWLDQYRHHPPVFACVLGFTETGLIPGISAAGKTPQDRQFTAIADAEFLVTGNQTNAQYPLPPLNLGISPVFISRAVAAALNIPVYLFNAGLPIAPNVPAIDLQGQPARCLSTGRALSLPMAQHLFEQGLGFGETLAGASPRHYLILGECVVGGTTTALGVLKGLNIDADGKVNSSHLQCNHRQKRQLVRQGLAAAKSLKTPLEIVAAVGDPMQAVIAGMAIAASQKTGVMLAGGTQNVSRLCLNSSVDAPAEFADPLKSNRGGNHPLGL